MADVQLPYWNGQTAIDDIRARTIRPDGSIANFEGKPFDKEIVKAGGIKFRAKTFSLPDVQPGCIIEYKYREQYDDRFLLGCAMDCARRLFYAARTFHIQAANEPGSPALYWRAHASRRYARA